VDEPIASFAGARRVRRRRGARWQTRAAAVTTRFAAALSLLCPSPSQARLKKLKQACGGQSLGEVTVDQAIGGMRGIPVGAKGRAADFQILGEGVACSA
jgi:hypothetical protein